ncbi:hypothetical protein BHE74_00040773 [Ensete ventricosum]|nr:hypothetical protein BHE74_00040773 [Ensete ventricosum]
MLLNFRGRAEVSTRPGSSRVRKVARVGRNWIFDPGCNRPSEVSALASVRSSTRLLRSASAPWILHKGLIGGGGVSDVTPPTPELVGFSEKGGELSFFSFEDSERAPFGVTERGFYTYRRGGRPYVWPYLCRHLEHGRVVRGLVGAVVWGEDMVRQVALMVRGGGSRVV